MNRWWLRSGRRRIASPRWRPFTRRARAEEAARTLLASLVKRRNRVQVRGVPMWDGAQRAALRMVLLAVGSAAMISGAMAFDGTLGTVAIVVAMGVLVFEGLR